MYLLYAHSDAPIACIDPNLITSIEVADYLDHPVKIYSIIRYHEYEWMEDTLVRFLGTRAVQKIVDVETLKELVPDIVVWTAIPVASDFNEARELGRKIENKFRKALVE